MPSAREMIAELLTRYMQRDRDDHGDTVDEVLTAFAAQAEALARLTAALIEIQGLRPFTAQEGLSQAQEIARRALAAISAPALPATGPCASGVKPGNGPCS